jgi:hypothetical protein
MTKEDASTGNTTDQLLSYVRMVEKAEGEIGPEARKLSRLLIGGQMSNDLVLQCADFLQLPTEHMWRLRVLLDAIDDDLAGKS